MDKPSFVHLSICGQTAFCPFVHMWTNCVLSILSAIGHKSIALSANGHHTHTYGMGFVHLSTSVSRQRSNAGRQEEEGGLSCTAVLPPLSPALAPYPQTNIQNKGA
jgi:hypothetical protein